MEFDICGPTGESETKSANEFDILAQNNEPIISFSPDRCRFDRINSRSNSLDISEFVLESPPSLSILNSGDMTNSSDTHSQTLTQPQNSATTMSTTAPNTTTNGESPRKQLSSSSTNNSNLQHQQQQRELQRRLEKRIAQASTSTSSSVGTRSGSSTSGNCKANLGPSTSSNSNSNSAFNHYPHQEYDNQSLGRIASVILNDYAVENSSAVPNPIVKSSSSTTNSNSMMSSSGFDMRKVPSLLPPQRLAIPQKTNTSTSCTTTTSLISTTNPPATGGGNTKPRSQEKKPLVQWDSEESEEELSFFPAPKLRSTLTDNLSIDNMSLSGEEDDLHLSPPRSMSNRCPCDPRLLMDSSTGKSRREKHCTII